MSRATDTKTCVACGERLPLTSFYLRRPDGEARQSRCKGCHNEKGTLLRTIDSRDGGKVTAERQADGTITLVRR